MNAVSPYFKAITAALVAGLTAILTGLDNDVLTKAEWVQAAIAFLVALSAVWAVPNKDPQAEHQDESVQPPTTGHGPGFTLDADR